MTTRVIPGLRAVRIVGSRPDPTAAMSTGEIARALSISLSSASRLCTALVECRLLSRGEAYGTYALGSEALALSGRAHAAQAGAVRSVLSRIVQRTGETAFVAAPADDGLRVTAAVSSPWTLFSPAVVGERIDDPDSAVVQAAADAAPAPTRHGQRIELAEAVRTPSGAVVAVLAMRLPVNRSTVGVSIAARALADERRALEADMVHRIRPSAARSTPPAPTEPVAALNAAVAMLRALAEGPADLDELSAAAGVRRDRAVRLRESCRAAGLVRVDAETGDASMEWVVHGWSRAALSPILLARAAPLVGRAADETGACAFITVLRGLRSVTVVEELRDQGEGLAMAPWLGRPCPLENADGGPTLVQDFSDDDIRAFLGPRVDAREAEEFLSRVHTVARAGVIAKESFEEAGQTAVSAPIRDAGGSVIAAACLVGATDLLRPRTAQLEQVARDLAARVSAMLDRDDVVEAASISRT